MKLIGNLKKKVENAKTKEEARDTIKKAGMLLDDDELAQVSGGANTSGDNSEFVDYNSNCEQSKNGIHIWVETVNHYYLCPECGKYSYNDPISDLMHKRPFSL